MEALHSAKPLQCEIAEQTINPNNNNKLKLMRRVYTSVSDSSDDDHWQSESVSCRSPLMISHLWHRQTADQSSRGQWLVCDGFSSVQVHNAYDLHATTPWRAELTEFTVNHARIGLCVSTFTHPVFDRVTHRVHDVEVAINYRVVKTNTWLLIQDHVQQRLEMSENDEINAKKVLASNVATCKIKKKPLINYKYT